MSIVKQMMVNGWTIVLLVVVLLVMNFLGIFDMLSVSANKCLLGEGLRCEQFYERNQSIIIVMGNNYNEEIYNVALDAVDCESTSIARLRTGEAGNISLICPFSGKRWSKNFNVLYEAGESRILRKNEAFVLLLAKEKRNNILAELKKAGAALLKS